MNSYLQSVLKEFNYYKSLGDQTIDRLDEKQLNFIPYETSNSITVLIQHLHGNMKSRWTDFLTSDGEKTWRNRDGEFKINNPSKEALLELWEEGWKTLLDAIEALEELDLDKKIYIRNMSHTVIEAINRQLSHYAFHVGQIVFIGKLILGKEWQSLSIPLNKSESYNKEKFLKGKRDLHYTDDLKKIPKL